jgi:hypothetical protein
MEIQELKNIQFRTFSSFENKVNIFFSDNEEGVTFDVLFDNDKHVLIFDNEQIHYKDIQDIQISFCMNKIGFRNIPSYKLHVFLNTKHWNFKRYLGLFEYQQNNIILDTLPKINPENFIEYQNFINNITEIEKINKDNEINTKKTKKSFFSFLFKKNLSKID